MVMHSNDNAACILSRHPPEAGPTCTPCDEILERTNIVELDGGEVAKCPKCGAEYVVFDFSHS